MGDFAVNMAVVHSRFGPGKVVDTRAESGQVKVAFSGFALWLPASALAVAQAPQAAQAPEAAPIPFPAPQGPPPVSSDTNERCALTTASAVPAVQEGAGTALTTASPAPVVEERAKSELATVSAVPVVEEKATRDRTLQKLIEGLRMGTVPDCGLGEWTVGRGDAIARIGGWLNDSQRGTLLVEGAYGSGKTHLIRHTAAMALNERFAVSQVRVDPTEENSSFPLRFYTCVMRDLQIPGWGATKLEFRQVLTEAVRRKQATCLDRHPFLGPLVERTRRRQDTEDDWAGLLGERRSGSVLPTWMDFTTVANIACNLFSAVSCFLADELDVRGLLLLIDEVETAEVRRYSYHWERTLNFLRGLAMAANDDEALDETVVVDRAGGTRYGAVTRLVYSGHYPGIKYYFRRPTHLKVLLALTECKVSGKLKEWKAEQPVLQLTEIRRDALVDLFGRLASVYEELFGVALSERDRAWALDSLLIKAHSVGSVRGFVKASIELLDFVRHNQGEPLEVLDAYRTF